MLKHTKYAKHASNKTPFGLYYTACMIVNVPQHPPRSENQIGPKTFPLPRSLDFLCLLNSSKQQCCNIPASSCIISDIDINQRKKKRKTAPHTPVYSLQWMEAQASWSQFDQLHKPHDHDLSISLPKGSQRPTAKCLIGAGSGSVSQKLQGLGALLLDLCEVSSSAEGKQTALWVHMYI